MIAVGLAAILGGTSLLAAPSASEQAAQRIVNVMMPPAKQKEGFNKLADRMVDQLAQKGLPPACLNDMRTALRDFMGKLVDEGVMNKMMASQFRDKLTDEEMLTFATFLESSVGQKFINKTISFDKERGDRDMKAIMDSKKTELMGVMIRILEKYNIPTQ